LNIGPKGDGSIPQKSIDSMQAIGRWMAANGEAIYGTTASPFERPAWGRYTKKPGKLFAHVFEWPRDGMLQVPTGDLRINRVYLLADPDKTMLDTEKKSDTTIIRLPQKAPDDIASVVVIEHNQ
jgi:alpha-L-fucosidase